MTTATETVEKERKGIVTLKGNPVTLVGPELKVGDKAPNFEVVAGDLSPVTLEAFKGKKVLFSVVPSLDTPVCDSQTRRFNEEAAQLPGVEIVTISADLPFAQKRWCGAASVDRIKALSDHRYTSFGKSYGVLIKELRILARAIFLVDSRGILRHVEIVKEIANHPDYEAARAAVRQAT